MLNRDACQEIQHAFSKPRLVSLISKESNLVFCLSVYKLVHSSTSSHDVKFYSFHVDDLIMTHTVK